MTYPFKLTAKCPQLPPHFQARRPPKPLDDLSNHDIDQALNFMLANGARDMLLPLTQYGRRIAVETHFRYERIKPVFDDPQPWTPKEAVQPR